MKTQLKLMAVLVGASLAVLATVFSAFASTPGLQRAGTVAAPAAPAELGIVEKAACTKMKASDVAWVTLTDEGDIDEQVEVYEGGTTTITPVFEYDCVPKKTTIVTVFTLDGEEIFSDKEPLKASNSKGLYGYPLSRTDEEPVDEGTWGVAFYNNKTLLTDGEIAVGEGGDGPSSAVTVQGTVKDAKTKKAIKGAIILVLQPGVTTEEFIDGGQKKTDVYTAAQTDSKGKFALPDQLERGTEYSIIGVAKGYKPVGQDRFVAEDDDPDPLELNITLKK